MNEMRIVFQDGNKVIPSFQISTIIKKNICNVWDEDLITNSILFGTYVVFDRKTNVHSFTIFYPKDLKQEIIQKYLDCFFFDHLWGELRCEFQYKNYIIDLLENSKFSLNEIQQQLKLAKQVKCEKISDDFPKLTKLGRAFMQEFHQKNCQNKKDYYYCRCFLEWSENDSTYDAKKIYPIVPYTG